MKRLLLAAALCAAALPVLGAPFVITDPVLSSSTHCGVFVDAQPKQVIVVTTENGNKICRFDITGLAGGSHTVRMTAIVDDPIHGVKESPQSAPLTFVVPVTPAAPANLRLVP